MKLEKYLGPVPVLSTLNVLVIVFLIYMIWSTVAKH